MTTITGNTLTALRERFGQALASRLPQHIARLGWDADQLAAHQRGQLRVLLATAAGHSRSTPAAWPGSTPGASSPASWPGCR